MGKAGRRRWALLLISQRHCTLQGQTSCAPDRPEPQTLLRLDLELSVSGLRSNPDMLLTHSPPLPTDLPLLGVPVLSQAQWRHREGRTAEAPGMGEDNFFWSLGKVFCSIARNKSSHEPCAVPELCPGLPRGCRGTSGTPGAACPSAITQLYCSSTNTQPEAPLAGCGSTAGAAPL